LAPDTPTPAVAELLAAVAQAPAVQTLRQRLEKGGVFSCTGICRAAQPFLGAVLRRAFPNRPVVVVTAGLHGQESAHQDLQTWVRLGCAESRVGNAGMESRLQPASRENRLKAELRTRPGAAPTCLQTGSENVGTGQPLFYPAWEILPHEAKLPHVDVISERLETLAALTAHAARSTLPSPLVVTSVAALLQRTFAPAALRERLRTLQRGDRLDPLDLVEWLEDQAYEPETQVNHRGEIALRGGIVDVFPLASPWPVRLEFFGNELESIRCFDPVSQISREEIPSVTIPPGGELGLLKRLAEKDPAALGTLADHLPPGTVFLLCEPEALAEQAGDYAAQVPAGDPFFVPWAEFQARFAATGTAVVQASEAEVAAGEISDPRSLIPDLGFASLEAFRPIAERAPEPHVAEAQRREFFAQLHRWLRQGYGVHVFCNNEGERERFGEIWEECGLSREPTVESRGRRPGEQPSTLDPRPSTHLGALSRGFLSDEAKVVVVTDAEIFGRYKVQRPRRLKSPHAQTSRSLLDIDFTDLEEGDCVVHVQHGIGRYRGLQRLPPTGGEKPLDKARPGSGGEECLVIEYAPRDPEQPPPKLYVPVGEAHLVSKYVGAGKARPPLNTLGGTRWAKAKEQAEQAVRDLAGELLSIQAARESLPGHAFGTDTPWQREFESAFLYEETPDQMKAILDTKSDMERPKPMDRLICGDVGYGKTEVAIRAAFKTVMGGKQVAVLVPTTVLAQQHFNTFRERMADYPIRIELLSRFRTARQQKRVIQGLLDGAVDIVIGTHRLIQDDIAFKDLGLVVIDEEQRFGVLHKEKFKMLRQLLDVLTLSATPIPRTLHLALTGARDMSTIETPPQDRLPVETIICQYDERVIRDAIQRELNRGGQVFYLHNRIFDIDSVADRLRALLPKARLRVGHGQMHSDDLEEVMTEFVNGEADVLLCTTIIESGIDIPNANTIIIDRADRFGLSDLYQLRGRVGRYKHQAYAYLLIPRHARMLTDARKRISAIKQFSTLGSGFRIAMRDLEIRGAGNLLGAQQSGHITAVGFELYCQLLKQSISRLKGEAVKPRIEVQVRLDFLSSSPTEEGRKVQSQKSQAQSSPGLQPQVQVHREVATYVEFEDAGGPESEEERPTAFQSGHACIPLDYVPDPRQRIEVYRNLAEVTEVSGLDRLQGELRDRFGPIPVPVELLLLVAGMKLRASAKGISAIETRQDKLMLTRGNDFITRDGKFPRLTKQAPKARLNEILRFLRTV
jgi:transcription-repair coupling factor (superfamily II helicase)